MKPFTKEQFEALNNFIKHSIAHIKFTCVEQPYQLSKDQAYALLVNDSEPDGVLVLSEEQIYWNSLKTYNPETHMLVPRGWSTEQLQLVLDESILNTQYEIISFHHAITKVFGGEK